MKRDGNDHHGELNTGKHCPFKAKTTFSKNMSTFKFYTSKIKFPINLRVRIPKAPYVPKQKNHCKGLLEVPFFEQVMISSTGEVI